MLPHDWSMASLLDSEDTLMTLKGRSRKQTWDVYWSPEGRKIATIEAVTERQAIRKAPQPYRKYLGEMYAIATNPEPARVVTCPQCGNRIPYEWNARGMIRCVQCHLLFENPTEEN